MNDQCAAQTPPSTRAWRIKMFFRSRLYTVGWVLRMLFARFAYRHVMRLTHYFGWHYAPIRGPVQPGGEYYRWCQWCGLRGTVYDLSGPLKRHGGDKGDAA